MKWKSNQIKSEDSTITILLLTGGSTVMSLSVRLDSNYPMNRIQQANEPISVLSKLL